MIKHWCKLNSDNYFNKFKLRFEQKCLPLNNGCISWTGSCIKHGYGQIKFENNNMLAHRAALLISGIEVPKDMDVLHICDNPNCVNTKHLIIGNHKDNMEDKANKGRAPSKLSSEQVIFIKQMLLKGTSCNSLAVKFGVNPHTISDIKKGVTWKHITT